MRRISQTLSGENLKTLQQTLEQQDAQSGWQVYSCKLVTPMYGGGVKAGEVDTEMPIRASAIRGQLRFWWRIACGPFASSQEMFKRETEIWGGIGDTGATASKVEVKVDCEPVQQSQLSVSTNQDSAAVKYAFGSAAINGDAYWLAAGYSFKICLRFPKSVSHEAETAFRWFASFGGLGARTRRGFGAILVQDCAPVAQQEVLDVGGVLRLIGNNSDNATTEWQNALEKLYRFRQGKGIGRRKGGTRPGRSFWPEPDQLRRFTKKDLNGAHQPEHMAGNVFPRAAFGLPITFDFRKVGEPQKLELLPAGGADRMASPLILRPYWNCSGWQRSALLLPGWEKALSQELEFKNAAYAPGHWPDDTEQRHQAAEAIEPMNSGNQLRALDPLSAFMQFFVEGN